MTDRRTGDVAQESFLTRRTDGEGRFAFPITLLGQEVYIVVYAAGFLPARMHLGTVWDGSSDVVVRVIESTAGPVRIEKGGAQVAGGKLRFCDGTTMERQTSGILKINSRGEVAGDWFERGRVYLITVTDDAGVRVGAGHLRWDGRRVVELTELVTLSAARAQGGASAGSGSPEEPSRR